MITEAFLQYLWAQRLYTSSSQITVCGEAIEVLNPGQLNTDAGPDFFNAQIRVGGVTWAGNVEIHLSSDDWYNHGHDSDHAYDNVILHVVGRSTGRVVRNSRGDTVPEVVLSYRPELLRRYESLAQGGGLTPIRCAENLPTMPAAVKQAWLDALFVERMEVKAGRILNFASMSNGDFDQAFFFAIARALAGHVNAEPMEMLVRSTPLRVLIKHSGVLQSEALLLGQAGLLSRQGVADDDYVAVLSREYKILSAKFGLEPIDGSVWKYARMRPQNFPDVRLVQLAAVVRALPGNFSSCLELPLDRVLAVSPSDYWRTHYRLGVASPERDKRLGEAGRRLILINAVVPFAFAMAKRFGNESRQEAAVDVLRAIKIEQNSVLRQWAGVGLSARDEADAQALIHLMSSYCNLGKCLLCRFGHYCVSRGVSPASYASISK